MYWIKFFFQNLYSWRVYILESVWICFNINFFIKLIHELGIRAHSSRLSVHPTYNNQSNSLGYPLNMGCSILWTKLTTPTPLTLSVNITSESYLKVILPTFYRGVARKTTLVGQYVVHEVHSKNFPYLINIH